jgi:glycosyltransferase involved in cell wall biosynthesis
MVCGLFVLANEACGAREVAQDGEHGWIRDYSAVDKLKHALIEAAGTGIQRLLEIGEAGRKHVCQRFSLDAMLAKYDLLYSAVAAGRIVNLEPVPTGTAASIC